MLLPLFEDIFHNRQSGKCAGPARVEGDVCQHLGCLRLCEAIVHRSTEMIRDLRNLTRRYQRTHGHQAAIARRECRAKPKVTEQQVGRVLDEPWRCGPKIGADLRCTLLLCFFIQRQQLVLRRWKLIDSDSTLMKDILRDGDR